MTQVKNKYETVIVLSTKLGEEGSTEMIEKFKALIAENGTVESVDDWGKRRLAYMINKETEGYYTLINFESTPDFTAELDRRYKITDGVLRTLIIKKDPVSQQLLQSRAKPLSRRRSTLRLSQPRLSRQTSPLLNKFFETKESCYLC